MKRILLLAFVLVGSLCVSATAQDKPKLLNLEPYRQDTLLQGSTITHQLYAVTVAIDGMAVTGLWEGMWVWTKAPNLVIGDEVDARIDGKKLIVKVDGKELRMNILRRERLKSSPSAVSQ